MREPERQQPGGVVRLVAHDVARLLDGRPVVAQAVCLDDERQVGPVEVDEEAVDASVRDGSRQVGASGDRQEAPLQLRPGQAERSPVERRAKDADAGPTDQPFERRPQRLGIDQVAPVGFTDRSLEPVPRELQRKVDVAQASSRRAPRAE